MNEQTIRRQHDQTSIPEISGQCCWGISAVLREPDGRYGPVYLKLSGSWHRFHLDADLLFWQEGPQPDSEDELLAGEKYVDLAVMLGVVGIPISRIELENSCLTLEFIN